MAARKNNKGRIAGSGTVSHARKERYQKACAERDRLLALATTEEEKQKAKAIQKQQQKSQWWPVGLQPAAAVGKLHLAKRSRKKRWRRKLHLAKRSRRKR